MLPPINCFGDDFSFFKARAALNARDIPTRHLKDAVPDAPFDHRRRGLITLKSGTKLYNLKREEFPLRASHLREPA